MASYRVRLIDNVAELRRLAPAWEAIAGGVPFRGPTWLLTWWRYYGDDDWGNPQRRLFSWAVEDGERLVGLAPWCIEWSRLGGSVIKTLGSGAVCSEYLTICSAAGEEAPVAAALAAQLCGEACDEWDRLDYDGASVGDPRLRLLFEALEAQGAAVERRSFIHCWRVSLPATWDEYLAQLSKGHRKQLRRLINDSLDTPRAVWHTTTRADEFERDWEVFLDLHQRRWQAVGEPGCFSNPAFAGFHRDVAKQFLAEGRLRLHRLELDGRPVAAEYHFSGDDVIYAYQSGLDPDALEREPGRVAAIAVIRGAIADGFRLYDLLRGDEPYKAHWRGEPTATESVSLAAPRAASRLRFELRRQARKIRGALVKKS
jgi:CelD/BcsL family acetyltransferase involved in cellulose biosynthesis